MNYHNTSLQQAKRKVFSDFVFWLYRVVISKSDNLKCEPHATDRLKLTATDIGAVFAHHMSEQAATDVGTHFDTHIRLAIALIDSQINSNLSKIDKYVQKLYSHSHEMTSFFATVNPSYQYDTLRPLLDLHIDLMRAIISARLCSEHRQEVIIFDALYENILNLADLYDDGIIDD
ncbi:MAG: hypothetical protein FWC80_03685 [Firmicutes bacterium]|nr:hypothetical protein [Bacillota bacterium]